jgi:hypothetical protein
MEHDQRYKSTLEQLSLSSYTIININMRKAHLSGGFLCIRFENLGDRKHLSNCYEYEKINECNTELKTCGEFAQTCWNYWKLKYSMQQRYIQDRTN